MESNHAFTLHPGIAAMAIAAVGAVTVMLDQSMRRPSLAGLVIRTLHTAL